MINIRNAQQIETMSKACRIAAEARAMAGKEIKPGVSLISLDRKIKNFIESKGARPSFLNYNGFPASACISLNDEVIHGIPDERILREGDIVSIDVGAYYLGYHGDCAATFAVGAISPEAKRLIAVTRQSFYDGIAAYRSNARLGDISSAIQKTIEAAGYSVVREFVGHGVGTNLHESPDVPNYGSPGHGTRLYSGMTLAIEPMVCAGAADVIITDNNWTVVTLDHSLSAHYENTVAITEEGIRILTVTEEDV